MVNWESEFKRYLAKKFKEVIGEELPIENISTIKVNMDIDITLLTIKELALIYAWAIMQENYEQAEIVKQELTKRNGKIEFDIDEKTKTGTINVYIVPKTSITCVDIKIKVLPDGMMIDFDKEEL